MSLFLLINFTFVYLFLFTLITLLLISQNARSRDSERFEDAQINRLMGSVISERTGDHSEQMNELLFGHSV